MKISEDNLTHNNKRIAYFLLCRFIVCALVHCHVKFCLNDYISYLVNSCIYCRIDVSLSDECATKGFSSNVSKSVVLVLDLKSNNVASLEVKLSDQVISSSESVTYQ